MKNLKDLPNGTLLVWDTNVKYYGEPEKRIYYPAIKAYNGQKNELWGALIITDNCANYMGDENENLRLPNADDYKALNWDKSIENYRKKLEAKK